MSGQFLWTAVLVTHHRPGGPGFSRWMVPPAASVQCISCIIGQAHAFSAFNLADDHSFIGIGPIGAGRLEISPILG